MGEFKVNCDAAVGDALSTLAVVVRDWRGIVVLAISRKANTSIPPKRKRKLFSGLLSWQMIMVLIEYALKVIQKFVWMLSFAIQRICLGEFKAVFLQLFRFPSILYSSMGKEEANGASHSLASWALKNRFWGLVDSFAAPLCFVDACKSDLYISGG
uniref:Uncharacterized protein n=1 Tax=Fagus sylvatica TaxID=28930 RepID=A0A2N9GSU9_FAGSY